MSAIDIGKSLGCTVIACCSTEDKLEAARKQGADVLINYSKDLKVGRLFWHDHVVVIVSSRHPPVAFLCRLNLKLKSCMGGSMWFMTPSVGLFQRWHCGRSAGGVDFLCADLQQGVPTQRQPYQVCP